MIKTDIILFLMILKSTSYTLHITTLQNINDYYTYTLILTIVIGYGVIDRYHIYVDAWKKQQQKKH